LIKVQFAGPPQSDQVAANEHFEGAVGFARVTQVAATAGAASIPGPVTDAFWDGWYGWHGIQGEFSFITAVGYHPNGGYRIDFDSKAMRKVGPNDALVIVAENASAVTGFTIAYQGSDLMKNTPRSRITVVGANACKEAAENVANNTFVAAGTTVAIRSVEPQSVARRGPRAINLLLNLLFGILTLRFRFQSAHATILIIIHHAFHKVKLRCTVVIMAEIIRFTIDKSPIRRTSTIFTTPQNIISRPESFQAPGSFCHFDLKSRVA
jgi:hypothetical protein